MTEAEWLVSEETHDMLECLLREHNAMRRPTLPRKLRLFACASCRLFCDATTDPRSLAAIEYVEQFADGKVDDAEMAEVNDAAHKALRGIDSRPPPEGMTITEMPGRLAAEAAFWLADKRANWCVYAALKTSAGIRDNTRCHDGTERDPKWAEQLRAMGQMLRDIFGNPFREVKFNKKWRTSDVMLLARGIYDDRAFDRMPILADALQDAGCDNADVLDHCRGPGPHVRGCWVVDLLLGKQ